MVSVVNTTFTFSLGKQLDLARLGRTLVNVEYEPAQFNGLKLRLRKPKCTALIYNSGSVVLLGCRSEVDARLASRRIARMICRIIEVYPRKLILQNMVGSYTHTKNLEDVIAALQKQTDYRWSYEPERFPGIIINFSTTSATYFNTGKVFFTGAKSEEDLETAFLDLLLLV